MDDQPGLRVLSAITSYWDLETHIFQVMRGVPADPVEALCRLGDYATAAQTP